MIYLGLDYGEKRIGIAVSDEMGRFAEPAGCILAERADESWKRLLDVIREARAETIVVGLPIRTTGELKQEAERVLEFVEALKKRVPVSVLTWDERLTTKEAERRLHEAGFNTRKMKMKKDAVAASIMLQNFLDARRMRCCDVQAD